MCNAPEKLAFRSLRSAAQQALDDLERGFVNRPYGDCPCGNFHLTSQPLGRSGELSADMVLALAAQLGLKGAAA